MANSKKSDEMENGIRSPWMSCPDSSPFLDNDAYFDAPGLKSTDLSQMDLSWLSQTPSLPLTHFQPHTHQFNSAQFHQPALPYSNPTATFFPPNTSSYSHAYASPQPASSLPALLSSQTAIHCRQVLEDPIRRKPGRKPKGTATSPLPVAYLAHLSSLSYDDEMVGDKKEERKFKNREAADQSRKRLKDRGRVLEEFTAGLEQENEGLREYLRVLQERG